MSNISEQFLTAMQIMVDSRLQALSFDRTIAGNIAEVLDKDTGKYRVTYEGGSADAYAQDITKEYSVNDQVYIKIPSNDATKNRIITGLVSNKSLTDEERTSQANQYVQMSGDLLGESYYNSAHGLNDEPCSINLNTSESKVDVDNFNNTSVDSRFSVLANKFRLLKIQAKFLTSFVNTHETGDYGLIFTFSTTEGEGKDISYVMSTKDYNGSVYEFGEYAEQSVIVEVATAGFLTGLKKIQVYQSGFNGETEGDSVSVKDIQMWFVEKQDLLENPHYATIVDVYGIGYDVSKGKRNCGFLTLNTDYYVQELETFEKAGTIQEEKVYICDIRPYSTNEYGIITAFHFLSSEDGDKEYYLLQRYPFGLVWDDFCTFYRASLFHASSDISEDPNTKYQWYQWDLDNASQEQDSWSRIAGYGWIPLEGETDRDYIATAAAVKYQAKYKVIASHDNNLASAELEVINSGGQAAHPFAITEVAGGMDNYTLKIVSTKEGGDNFAFTGNWYWSPPNGLPRKISGDTSRVDQNVYSYLKDDASVFYVHVFATKDDTTLDLGYTTHVVYKENYTKTIPVTVEFTGDDLHKYDAAGQLQLKDILDYDNSDKIYTLSATTHWTQQPADMVEQLVWYYKNGDSDIIITTEHKQPPNSMIQSIWLDENRKICYTIKRTYRKEYSNNTLRLAVSRTDEVGDHIFTKEITFLKDGDLGTNGTRYVAIIGPRGAFDGEKAGGDSRTLTCYVYKDGSEITSDNSAYLISYQWYSGVEKIIGETNKTYDYTLSNYDFSSPTPIFLQCEATIKDKTESLRNGEPVTTVIRDIFPIDVKKGNGADISGVPTEVVYSSSGYAPNSKINFNFSGTISKLTGSIVSVSREGSTSNYSLNVPLFFDGASMPISGVLPKARNYYNDSDCINVAGQVTANTNVTRTNSRTWSFTKNSVRYYANTNDVEVDKLIPNTQVGFLRCKTNSNNYVDHPIILHLNTYGNEAINGWDGTALDIDGNGQYIFAPQIGAGEKNSNNQFTGVVMGRDSQQQRIGLYGYETGVNSFGLMDNGKAFFGRADGGGRIWIDGTSAVIAGGNCIKDKDASSAVLDEDGMILRLNKGESSSSHKDTPAIQVGKYNTNKGMFEVSYGGKVYAQEAEINGKIYAIEGKIGGSNSDTHGWAINEDKLTGGRVTLYSGSEFVHSEIRSATNLKQLVLKNNNTYTDEDYLIIIYNFDDDGHGININGYSKNIKFSILDKSTFTPIGNQIPIAEVKNFTLENGEIIWVDNSSYQYRIWAGSSSTSPDTAKFSVTDSGYLKATDAYITGTIHAGKGGTIGSWTISSSGIYSNNGKVGMSNQGTLRFWVGDNLSVDSNTGRGSYTQAILKGGSYYYNSPTATSGTPISQDTTIYNVTDTGGNGKYQYSFTFSNSSSATTYYASSFSISGTTWFYVNSAGEMQCRNAEIQGKIAATSGEIGGWTIASNKLKNSDESVCLGKTEFKFGDKFVVNNNGLTVKGEIKATSGFIGSSDTSGWKINNYGINNSDNKVGISNDGNFWFWASNKAVTYEEGKNGSVNKFNDNDTAHFGVKNDGSVDCKGGIFVTSKTSGMYTYSTEISGGEFGIYAKQSGDTSRTKWGSITGWAQGLLMEAETNFYIKCNSDISIYAQKSSTDPSTKKARIYIGEKGDTSVAHTRTTDLISLTAKAITLSSDNYTDTAPTASTSGTSGQLLFVYSNS